MSARRDVTVSRTLLYLTALVIIVGAFVLLGVGHGWLDWCTEDVLWVQRIWIGFRSWL